MAFKMSTDGKMLKFRAAKLKGFIYILIVKINLKFKLIIFN